jgi:predicted glycogen debranching enzyme
MLGYAGRPYLIATTEYEGGTLTPAGYIHLRHFRLERGLPTTTFELGDTTLEKTVWLAHGQNTTYIRYRLADDASGPAELQLRPLIGGRLSHQLSTAAIEAPAVSPLADGCLIGLAALELDLQLRLSTGGFTAAGDWYWRVSYRRERERGADYQENLFAPGILTALLDPGQAVVLTISSEPPAYLDHPPVVAWQREWQRRGRLIERASAQGDPLGETLTLAADAFLVGRAGSNADVAPQCSVIAGYPWLAERVVDSLIALPGLTLASGRPADGRAILTTLLARRWEGLLPARFDDESGRPGDGPPEANLWLFVALSAYLTQVPDATLLAEAWPALVEIIDAYERGTPAGVRVDTTDGLLRIGELAPGSRWQEAQAGDHMPAVERGKPVALNALWYNALCQMAAWAVQQAPQRSAGYQLAAERVETSFKSGYWYAPSGYLYHSIDTPNGHDRSLRPHQLLAIALPFPVLGRDRWRPVLDAVTDHLLTPVGLRTLSPVDPNYIGWYAGDTGHRAAAFAQGAVWPWLIGVYCDAYKRVYRDYGALRDHLRALGRHLQTAGVGFVSELFDGDTPHSPQGTIAQATSVAALLRLWRILADDQPANQPPSYPSEWARE